MLNGMGWLEHASPELRAEVARRGDLIKMREACTLYRAEDPTGGIYGVVSGRLDMHLPLWGADCSLAHVCGPGWWVGDLAAISGEPRRFEVSVQRGTRLTRLSRAEIGRICNLFPEMHQCLLAMMTYNMRVLIDTVEGFGFSEPTRRIAACLLRLDRTGPAWQGRLPITQGELAIIAKLSRRRTNAALNDLEADGALRLRYGQIEVCNRRSLRALADGNDPPRLA